MSLAKLLLSLFFILSLSHIITSKLPTPAINLTVTNKGLNGALNLLIPRICQLLSIIDLPPYHETLHLPLIGDVQLDITELHIKEVSLESLTLRNDPAAPNAFAVDMNNLKLILQDNWHFKEVKFPHAEGHGDSVIGVQGASATVLMQMMTDEQGKSFLWISKPQDLQIRLGDLHVEIHGGISGALTQALAKLFGTLMKPLIEQAIRDTLAKEVNEDLKQLLQSLSFMLPLEWSGFAPEIVDWNMKQLQNPNFGDEFALFGVRGDWSIRNKPTPEPLFIPGKLPSEPLYTDAMLNVFMSNYVLKDFFSTAQEGKLFHWHITNSMVPTESPYKLNTASLKYVFPQLYERYNNSDLAMDVGLIMQPDIEVNSTNGFEIRFRTSMKFSVVESNLTLTKVFTLTTKVNLQVDDLGLVNVHDGRAVNVTGHISDLGISVTMFDTAIGPLDLGYLMNQIKIIVTFGYLPKLNMQLKEGITIELPDTLLGQMHLSNTQFSFQDGFVAFASSFDFKMGEHLMRNKASFTQEERLRHQIWKLEKELLEKQEKLKRLEQDDQRIPVL